MSLVVKRGFINKMKFGEVLVGEQDETLGNRKLFKQNAGSEMRKWKGACLQHKINYSTKLKYTLKNSGW